MISPIMRKISPPNTMFLRPRRSPMNTVMIAEVKHPKFQIARVKPDVTDRIRPVSGPA